MARRVFLNEGNDKEWVDIVKLSDAESNRIYDRNKYMPGAKGATMDRASKVAREYVQARVVDWGGFTHKGVEVPCTNENKLMLLDTMGLDADGEKTNLWRILSDKFDALEDADAKN